MKWWAFFLPLLLVGCGPKLDSEDWRERVKAVKKASDGVVLSEVATNDKDGDVRAAALNRLDTLNLDTGFVASLLAYVSEVPEEHRYRIAAELVLLFPHLEELSLKRQTGELVFFDVKWKETSKTYKNLGAEGGFALLGETVSVWMEFDLLPEAIRATWGTEFEQMVISDDPDDRFVASSLDYRELLDGLLDQLSLAALDKFARQALSEDLRAMAQSKADAIHHDLHHDDYSMRREAVTRLESHRLLDTIAVKDENYMVRATAIERLDDPILLQRIIWNEKDKFALRLAKERFAILGARKAKSPEELLEEKREMMRELRDQKRQAYQEAEERFLKSLAAPEA